MPLHRQANSLWSQVSPCSSVQIFQPPLANAAKNWGERFVLSLWWWQQVPLDFFLVSSYFPLPAPQPSSSCCLIAFHMLVEDSDHLPYKVMVTGIWHKQLSNWCCSVEQDTKRQKQGVRKICHEDTGHRDDFRKCLSSIFTTVLWTSPGDSSQRNDADSSEVTLERLGLDSCSANLMQFLCDFTLSGTQVALKSQEPLCIQSCILGLRSRNRVIG